MWPATDDIKATQDRIEHFTIPEFQSIRFVRHEHSHDSKKSTTALTWNRIEQRQE